jgi:hypothetical protein
VSGSIKRLPAAVAGGRRQPRANGRALHVAVDGGAESLIIPNH